MGKIGGIVVSIIWITADLMILFYPGLGSLLSGTTGLSPLVLSLGVLVFGTAMSWLAARE